MVAEMGVVRGGSGAVGLENVAGDLGACGVEDVDGHAGRDNVEEVVGLEPAGVGGDVVGHGGVMGVLAAMWKVAERERGGAE